MKIIKTKFKGLLILKQNIYKDKRGNLRVTYNKKKFKKDFIYEYCTVSKKNVLRGFHFQTKFIQSKFVNVVKGRILDVVIDLRKNSKTFGKHFSIKLNEKNCTSVFIPPGFAHGFLALKRENIVCYSCTEYRYPSYERSLKYNDPKLKIKWPLKKPNLSVKDKNAYNLDFFTK